MKRKYDYEEDIDFAELSEDENDNVQCNHPEQRNCLCCPDAMTCEFIDSRLGLEDDWPTFQCRHDGECGGCPDFYECPTIFGGDENGRW